MISLESYSFWIYIYIKHKILPASTSKIPYLHIWMAYIIYETLYNEIKRNKIKVMLILLILLVILFHSEAALYLTGVSK